MEKVIFKNAEQAREYLYKAIVTFRYKKRDGTIRNAIATTNDYFIPKKLKAVKDKIDNHTATKAIAYFDLQKLEWRSFKFEKLVSEANIFQIEIKK